MAIPFTSQSRFWPGGGAWPTPFSPTYVFPQTPTKSGEYGSAIISRAASYLSDKHSDMWEPSWFGESIGHYEAGHAGGRHVGSQAARITTSIPSVLRTSEKPTSRRAFTISRTAGFCL